MSERGTSNGNSRGSSAARKVRRLWLLTEFGDGVSAPCAYCRVLLTVDTVTVDRFPVPGCQGGTYRRTNIRPACGPCNSRHGGALRSH
jgi:hypothetical protein